MNHCHRCNSDYEKPGTCNCYAPQAAQPWPLPFVQVIPPAHPGVITPYEYPNIAPWRPTYGTGGTATYSGPPLTIYQ